MRLEVTGSPPLPKLLTVKEFFVDTLGLSLPMGYKVIREGGISTIKIGASVRIHPSDAEKFIEERRGRRNGRAAG